MGPPSKTIIINHNNDKKKKKKKKKKKNNHKLKGWLGTEQASRQVSKPVKAHKIHSPTPKNPDKTRASPGKCASDFHMAVGWHHFGVGAAPILVYFSGDWDVHWGSGLLTHGHIFFAEAGASFGRLRHGQRHRSCRISFRHRNEAPGNGVRPLWLCDRRKGAERVGCALKTWPVS